jgi:hypothetical protein
LRPGARNLAALVIVAAGLLIGGCGSDSQESEDEIVQNGIEQINESMDQVSSAAANGLAIHNAELQLQLKGPDETQASAAGQTSLKSHQPQTAGEGRGSKSWPSTPSPTSSTVRSTRSRSSGEDSTSTFSPSST